MTGGLLSRFLSSRRDSLRRGQLDNRGLEDVVSDIARRLEPEAGSPLVVVEVGTGGGRGSTVAIHRALVEAGSPFELVGYEGDSELARLAARRWDGVENVRVVNEYFMHRGDIERCIEPLIAAEDRDAYLATFAEVASRENFLSTEPPGPIDLLFVDSVRYTHLAILQAAGRWLRSQSVVLMEDDIPDYGELAIVGGALELARVVRHPLEGHPWPLVEFGVVQT